jgi:hypothetical protein
MSDLKASLQFTCTLMVEPPALRLTYIVKNGSAAPIGLFNRIQGVHFDGRVNLSPELIYSDIQGKILELSKMVLPIPEGLQVSERVLPHVMKVDPGKEFKEEIALRVPVEAFQPYRRALLQGQNPEADVVADKPAKAEEVQVNLGVFAVTPQMKLVPVSPAYPDVFRVWPPGPAFEGQVVLGQRIKLAAPLAVLDYRVAPPPKK